MSRPFVPLLLCASLACSAAARADGGSGAPPSRDDASAGPGAAPTLFVTYGVTDLSALHDVGAARAISLQGLRWRDALLYNELAWAPAPGGHALVRGGTALVTASPLPRTQLTLGDRTPDDVTAWAVPVRLAGIELKPARGTLAPPEHARLDGARQSGEVELDADGLSIRHDTAPMSILARDVLGFNDVATIAVPTAELNLGTASRPLLRRGDTDFDYAIGAARRDDASARFAYAGPAFVAEQRLGIADGITVGARSAGAGGLVTTGVELGLALGDLGTVTSTAAVARGEGESAPATSLRYALARGPLELRATYRAAPSDTSPFNDVPGVATGASAQSLGARVAYTLPDASVFTVEGGRSAWGDYGGRSALALAYRLPGFDRWELEGRAGYHTALSALPGTSDAWGASLNLRVRLDSTPARACGAASFATACGGT